MKFDRHQTFHPTFAARSKNVSLEISNFSCWTGLVVFYVQQLQVLRIRMLICSNNRSKKFEFDNRMFYFNAFRNQIILQTKVEQGNTQNCPPAVVKKPYQL